MRSLAADLGELARIGADPAGGVSRFAWTESLERANRWFVERLEEVELAPELDTAGNVIGRWEAGDGKAVLVGSHLDTVRRGGRFDGALGVLSALEAVRILKREGVELRRPLWLVSFNDEEGARFHTALLGSKAFTGDLDLGYWELAGVPQAMAASGRSFDRLHEATAVDRVAAFLELHIEQGPVLESRGIDLGIVTSVVGLLGFRARFRGEANHAGTTPMGGRRDALLGAARATAALRDEARKQDGMTANVGQIRVEPGGFNIIPGLAEFSIDVRSQSLEGHRRLESWVPELLTEIARDEGLEVELEETQRVTPVPLDEELATVLERAAGAEGASTLRMASGAGHDAMVLARNVPTGLLFVPSRGGISHSPEEYTAPEHCELGARVLARALGELLTQSKETA